MAQIINRKTPEIVARGRGYGVDYITVMERGIFFPKGVAARVGISLNKYIQFINDGSFWCFFINNDPDGFKFASAGRKGGYVINSEALSKMFLRSTGKEMNDKLLISPTPSRRESNVIYEINLK